LTESLGRFGKFAELYKALKDEIVKHVEQLKRQLLSVPVTQDLLRRLNLSWNTFCSQLTIIRNVFMELDRVYIFPNTKFFSFKLKKKKKKKKEKEKEFIRGIFD
jgi:cullin-4